ncbi:MAG: diphthine--ammonia ligase [Ruminococcus sp.]|jgi:diphthine-ammonia ligase
MAEKIKAAASYSGGKDGALALYRAVKMGYEPVSLLTTYNEGKGSSWFHGIPSKVLEEVSRSMGIPLELVSTGPADDYEREFTEALKRLKNQGAEKCIFGDIDIQEHFDWCDSCCRKAGMESLFPLWNEKREDLVFEMIDSGFQTVITIVDTARMSEKFLGRTITKELAREIAGQGADICGENGEYHSFVYDGPLFRYPIPLHFGEIIRQGNYAILPLKG